MEVVKKLNPTPEPWQGGVRMPSRSLQPQDLGSASPIPSRFGMNMYGSVWKLVWVDLVVWIIMYAILSVIYRTALSVEQRRVFEDVCIFFDTYSAFIPITFMLGFYVNAVFGRWERIFDNIGWIDSPALTITTYIQGTSERARIIRRNALRYMVLTQAIVYRDVASTVRKRFPTMNHLVTGGLMTERELEIFDSITSAHKKYWVPMNWLFNNLRLARQEGFINSDILYSDVMEKVRIYRASVLNLTLFDWVPVPLVYTQVVHLAVRTYFLIALLGRQYLSMDRDSVSDKKSIDLYVPIMSILQFIFFIGWMKTAEVLLNPLGEDDDDFEVNYILDRNLQVGLSIVDDAHDKYPVLERDIFWEDDLPEPLYTVESAQRPSNPQVGSCSTMSGFEDDHFMLRFRKRTMSGMSNRHDLDFDESDVVPVQGLDKLHKNSMDNSCDSLSISQTLKNQNRKFSDMLTRLKGNTRRQSLSASVKNVMKNKTRSEANLNGEPNLNRSCDSMEQFGESFYNNSAPPVPHAPKTANDVGGRLESNDESEEPPHGAPGTQRNVSWTVDELLPVIQEEDQERKRNSDGESMKSSSATTASMKTKNESEERLDEEPEVKKEERKEEEDEDSENSLSPTNSEPDSSPELPKMKRKQEGKHERRRFNSE